MVTLVTIEQLLDTKLAQLENRVIKEFKNNVHNKSITSNVIPASAIVSASDVVPAEPKDTPLMHTPSISVKSFHDECVEFVEQINCLSHIY